MKKIQQVMENNETMLADGFEAAIIGLDTSNDVFRVVYDKDKMVDILIADNMTYGQAMEYLEYNVFNTYVGEGTPIYVHGGSHERVLELISQL
jgi:hypothetical protein